MKTSKPYIILTGTVSELEKKISQKIEEGYKCKGGLANFGKRHNITVVFAQAMVRRDSSDGAGA